MDKDMIDQINLAISAFKKRGEKFMIMLVPTEVSSYHEAILYPTIPRNMVPFSNGYEESSLQEEKDNTKEVIKTLLDYV